MKAYDCLLLHRTRSIWASILLGSCVGSSCYGQAMIDIRNPLPGIVDAAVYQVDGVTRVDNDSFASMHHTQVFAQLFAGEEVDASSPVGELMPMGADDTAGYWNPGTSSVVALPGIEAGQTVWVQIRVMEFTAGPGGTKIAQYGQSQLLRLTTKEEPVPLSGLRDFQLLPPSLYVYARTDEVVVEGWGPGYSLEAADFPGGPWTEIERELNDPSYIDMMMGFTARERIAHRSRFYRLRRL